MNNLDSMEVIEDKKSSTNTDDLKQAPTKKVKTNNEGDFIRIEPSSPAHYAPEGHVTNIPQENPPSSYDRIDTRDNFPQESLSSSKGHDSHSQIEIRNCTDMMSFYGNIDFSSVPLTVPPQQEKVCAKKPEANQKKIYREAIDRDPTLSTEAKRICLSSDEAEIEGLLQEIRVRSIFKAFMKVSPRRCRFKMSRNELREIKKRQQTLNNTKMELLTDFELDGVYYGSLQPEKEWLPGPLFMNLTRISDNSNPPAEGLSHFLLEVKSSTKVQKAKKNSQLEQDLNSAKTPLDKYKVYWGFVIKRLILKGNSFIELLKTNSQCSVLSQTDTSSTASDSNISKNVHLILLLNGKFPGDDEINVFKEILTTLETEKKFLEKNTQVLSLQVWYYHGKGLGAHIEETHSTDIRRLNKSVATLTTELTTVKTELTTVKTKLTTVQTELTTVKTELTTVKTELTTVQTELTTVKTELTTVQTELTTLQSHFDERVKEMIDRRFDERDKEMLNASLASGEMK